MPRTDFFNFFNKVKRSLLKRKLLKKFGGDVDRFVEEYSKPKVLSLYRDWMKTLDKTLPLALREVSKQQLRNYFQTAKEDYSPYLILNELDAGQYALELWKEV
ncbi:hypothetical protein ABK040_006479 [Willaertia magna]